MIIFFKDKTQRKLKNYIEHLIKNGATEKEIEEIQTKYDLEYKFAIENGLSQSRKLY